MKFYQENNINPAASCLPLLAQFPVFFALFFVLQDFSKDPPPGPLGWLHIVPSIADPANSHWSGYLLLAIYAGSQVLSTYFMSTTMDKTQRDDHDGRPAGLHRRRRALPGRPRPLLGDDEPVDGRPGPRSRGGSCRRRRSRRRRPEADVAEAAGRRHGGNGARREPPKPKPRPKPPPQQPRRVKRKKGGARR